MQPILSIVIPTYNVEDTLEHAIKSITKQKKYSKKTVEIIIVDDCSTDKTFQVAQKIESSNIHVYKLDKNSGAAGAPRNKGVEVAIGKFITFLDPDDEYLEGTFEIFFKKFKTIGEFDILSFTYTFGFKPIAQQWSWSGKYEGLISDNLLFGFTRTPAIWTKIYSSKFLDKVKIQQVEGIAGQDYIFNIMTLSKAHNVYHYEIPIVRYDNTRDGSMTNTKGIAFTNKYVTFFEICLEQFEGRALEMFKESRLQKTLLWVLTKTDPEQMDETMAARIRSLIKLMDPLMTHELFVNLGESKDLNEFNEILSCITTSNTISGKINLMFNKYNSMEKYEKIR